MYRRFNKSVAAVTSDREEIVTKDFLIGEVFVTKIPSGGRIAFYFGRDSDPLYIEDPVSFRPTDEERINGLFWTNEVALAGQTVDIYVSSAKRGQLQPLSL